MPVLSLCGLLLYLLFEVATSQNCLRTSCEEGHYCSGNDCIPCPPGHYQHDGVHQLTSCKLWTTKPPNSHYVRIKNGTSTSDAEWKCRDGYVEKEYTINRFHCVKIPPRVPSTITTEASTNGITSPELVNTTEIPKPVKGNAGSEQIGLIIGLSLGLPAFIVLVSVAIIVFFKRRKINLDRARDATDTVAYPLMLGNSTQNNKEKYYKFFKIIVENLGNSLAEMFVKTVHDPSGKFIPDKVIQLESDKTKDSVTYLTNSLVCWATLNNGIRRNIIQESLDFVGRPNLLNENEKEIEENVFIDEGYVITEGNGAIFRNTSPSGSRNENISLIAERKLNSQERNKLFYHLALKLGGDVHDFLQRLPEVGNDKFNASVNYEKLHQQKKDSNGSFAQTLQELWHRDQAQTLIKIDSLLAELDRNDILESESFKNLSKKTISTSNICPTSSTDDVTDSTSNIRPTVNNDDVTDSTSINSPTLSNDDVTDSASINSPTLSNGDVTDSASINYPTVSNDHATVRINSRRMNCPQPV